LARTSGKAGTDGDEVDDTVDGEIQVMADIHHNGDDVDSESDEEGMSSDTHQNVEQTLQSSSRPQLMDGDLATTVNQPHGLERRRAGGATGDICSWSC